MCVGGGEIPPPKKKSGSVTVYAKTTVHCSPALVLIQNEAADSGADPREAGGSGGRVGKNPGFFKKTQPSGFFWVFWVFLGFLGFFGFFCPDERVFRVFSVSRIPLDASRL